MGLSTFVTLSLGLLAALPTTFAAESSPYYRLRAKVTGPKTDTTPDVDGWAIEIRRLGITTRLPPDYMWGVLYNETFSPGRGGDIFYTQPVDGTTYIRTDAPNNEGEVTPFGFDMGEGYELVSAETIATRSILSETPMDITTDGDVPILEKPGFDATFVACKEAYREWVLVYWTDLAKYGTDPIYNQPDWRTCTEIQLIPECSTDGPQHDGLEDTACVTDIGTVL